MKLATSLLFLVFLTVGVLGTWHAAQANDIAVDTNADDTTVNGNCTLREAIAAANTNSAVDNCPGGDASPTVDTIDLSAIANQTVTLLLGQLTITEEVTINGFALFRTTVDGNNAGRVFSVSAHTTLNDVNLEIHAGEFIASRAPRGGQNRGAEFTGARREAQQGLQPFHALRMPVRIAMTKERGIDEKRRIHETRRAMRRAACWPSHRAQEGALP